MIDLDVRRLRVLREVALRGTVAAAADALGYTPSAISQQLAALERESGWTLFERAGRRLRLTDAGQLLVERSDAVLRALEEAVGALEAAATTVTGEVRISSPPSVAAALVIPVVVGLADEHPDLRVSVHELEVDDALRELRLGGLDVVVIHEYDHARLEPLADLQRVELFSEPMMVAAPAGRFRGPVALADLAAERWATEPADTSCGQAVRESCRAAGFEPDVRFSSTEFRVNLAAVATGAVSLLPQLAFVDAPSGIDVLPVRDLPTRRIVFAAHRTGSTARPSIAALVDRLTAAGHALATRLEAARRATMVACASPSPARSPKKARPTASRSGGRSSRAR